MIWETLHHPTLSLPVIRRKASEELLTLLAGTTELLLTRGASSIYGTAYPSTHAFHASVKRLEKNGLLAHQTHNGNLPILALTPTARHRVPDYIHPNRQWSKRWNKWWYILMFDVPEAQRKYRDTLRRFLKKKQFGCLQKSVWVTPKDVRPDYDDLDRGAAVDSVAFLFEARTVLGYGNQSVVQQAWNFDSLFQIQNLYIQTALENINRLKASEPASDDLFDLLRMDNLAYSQAMSLDPLLPRELHPEIYVGEKAYTIHKKLTDLLVSRLNENHE